MFVFSEVNISYHIHDITLNLSTSSLSLQKTPLENMYGIWSLFSVILYCENILILNVPWLRIISRGLFKFLFLKYAHSTEALVSIQMVDKVNIYIRTTIFAVTKYQKCKHSMYYYYYYYYYYYRISHFSASADKHSPILWYAINSNRLGGLICNLKSFLQLNMFQELQIFAFVYTYSDAG